MRLVVNPGIPLRGSVTVPGDKSLSHRAMLFSALAEGESRITNFSMSGVTRVMLQALSALGVEWQNAGDELIVLGRGLAGWHPPTQPLDCGNSATTFRLLAGALAAAGIPAVLDGSSGLRRRPMDRIVDPLSRMGAVIETAEGCVAPLRITGREKNCLLRPLDESLSVASAQVKSCLLLAALSASGPMTLLEPGPSRDHTERMLSSMGAGIEKYVIEGDSADSYVTRIQPLNEPLRPIQMRLPGDISAAAFLIVAALITPGSEVFIPGVGINPTRTGIIDVLKQMGGDITISNQSLQAGEPIGDISVRYSSLVGTDVFGPVVVRMIDEFSVFGVAAAYSDGQTTVRDAAELRIKESDRISTLCQELVKLNVDIVESRDGFTVNGKRFTSGATVLSHGDHRLAMALAVFGLGASAPVCIDGAEIIDESFPGFFACLQELGANVSTTGGRLA